MNEGTATRRTEDAALDQAAEEYLREVATGQTPRLAEFALRYGVRVADLEAFAQDYQWFSDLAKRVLPGTDSASPTVVKGFGDYELIGKPLGRGGMGVVYKARQISLDRFVAVKLIVAGALATPAEIRRFYDEARLAGRLHHPNIVAIYDVGRVEGQHFYSMDFVAGQTLDAMINERGPMTPRDAAACLLASARAVSFAHSERVIHRDLKPSNILLDVDGQPRLADFGLAKQMQGDSQATETHGVLGTPSYMAPEQARGDIKAIDERTDVYGLGAVLYKALTGLPPFQGATPLDILKQVTYSEPTRPRSLNAKVPLDLETICLKCLQKSPSSRYASAAELAEDFDRYLKGEPVKARPVGRLQKLLMHARRRPLVTSLSAVLALSLIVGLVGITTQYLRAESALHMARMNLSRAESNLQKAVDALSFIGHEIGEIELAAIPRMQKLQRRVLQRAVEYNQELLKDNLNDRRAKREAGQAYIRIADLQSTLGDYEEAEGAFRKAIELLTNFRNREPSDLDAQRQLRRAQYGLANLMIDGHHFEAAGELVELLQAAFPPSADRATMSIDDLELRGGVEALVGRQRVHQQEFDDATTHFKEALETTQVLTARAGGDDRYDNELANRFLGLGFALRRHGRTDEAIKAYKQAIEILGRIGDELLLGVAWRDLGIAYRKSGDLQQAVEAYEQARDALAPLVEFSPDSVRVLSELAETLHGVALVELERRRFRVAVPLLNEAIAHQQSIVEKFPENIEFRKRLRNQLYSVSLAYLEVHDHSQAAQQIDKFLSMAIDPIDHVNTAIALLSCKEAAEGDVQLSQARRQEVADQYARRAIQVLGSAKDQGLITSQFLSSDKRFSPLKRYSDSLALFGDEK